VTDCDALEASIDETCAFDGDTTQQFADDVRANGGDYSIYFWVKPTENKDALDLNGQFQPHLGFYQSLSPAFASVHLGATHSVRHPHTCHPRNAHAGLHLSSPSSLSSALAQRAST
jgi:hypothetical protein